MTNDSDKDKKRVWMLIPKKRDIYVPGFDGTFHEARESALARSKANRTSYEIWEVDPSKYRVQGGLKKLWEVIKFR